MPNDEVSYKEIKKEIRKNKAARRKGPLAPYRMAFSFIFAAVTCLGDLLSSAQSGTDIARSGFRFAAAFAIAWAALGLIDAMLASAGRQADREDS